MVCGYHALLREYLLHPHRSCRATDSQPADPIRHAFRMHMNNTPYMSFKRQ